MQRKLSGCISSPRSKNLIAFDFDRTMLLALILVSVALTAGKFYININFIELLFANKLLKPE